MKFCASIPLLNVIRKRLLSNRSLVRRFVCYLFRGFEPRSRFRSLLFRAGEACRMFEVPNHFDRPVAGKQRRCPSVITLKPAAYDHFKTGHSGWPET
jgi:hypothetical protein